MTTINDVLDVQVSRSTQTVLRKNFNIPAFLSEHSVFPERFRVYSDADELLEDGFTSTSVEYIAAVKAFSQKVVPTTMVFGKKEVLTVNGAITTVANSTTYTITVSGSEFTFTSDSNATAIEIVAGLKVSYDAAPITGVVFTDNLDGTFTLVSNTFAWGVTCSSNITLVNGTSTESWTDALQALEDENTQWFGLTISSHNADDIKEVAAWISTKQKIYGAASELSSILTSATTDVASELKALGYVNTFLFYHSKADEHYPEVALMAYQLQEKPGTNDWIYKELIGVTPDKLNGTATHNLRNKNAISYEDVYGEGGVTTTSTMVGGEYIDRVVYTYYITARIKEALWFDTINRSKRPYNNSGAASIQAIIWGELQRGIDDKVIDAIPRPQVFVPDTNSIAANTRAQRIYEGVTFTFKYSDSMQYVQIRGTLTV